MEETVPDQKPRWKKRRYWLGGLVILLLIALAIAWSQRQSIATSYLDDYLAEAGVTGQYEINVIGPNHQRVENLVIGDPDSPDLTIDRVDVYLRLGFGYPAIRSVIADGVRVNARYADGAFDFGQLGRLLPEPSDEPFVLPDMRLRLSDALMRLDTPYGPVAIAAAGSGDLESGFRGHVATASPGLTSPECAADRVRGSFAVRVTDRRPMIEGPLRAATLDCPGFDLAMDAPIVSVDAILSESLDRWGGDGLLRAAAVRQASGTAGTTRLAFTFDGTAGGQTVGTIRLRAEDASAFDVAAGEALLAGHFRIRDGGQSVGFDGDVQLARARAGEALLRDIAEPLRMAAGTPLDPVGMVIARAVQAAGRDFSASFALTGVVNDNGAALRFAELSGSSGSGAELTLERGDGIQYGLDDGRMRFSGAMRLEGGGFPQSYLAIEQGRAGAPIEGYAEIAPVRTGNAVFSLAPVRFTAADNGLTRLVTQVEMTGPLADGRIERLRMPIAGTIGAGGRLAIGQGCVPLRWDRMRVAGMIVGPTTLPFCPIEGGTLVRYSPEIGLSGGGQLIRPRLNGRLGETPLAISAHSFRMPLSRPSFAIRNLAVTLGAQGSQSELLVADMSADFVTGGVDGVFSGATGALVDVPIRVQESFGDWRFVGGVLQVAGEGGVINDVEDPLFEPLALRDMALRMENQLIRVTAGLHEPNSDILVANVDLFHDLQIGRGEAVLDTERLAFNDRIQPTDLTDLVLGIVAEVEGLVSGTGTIRWDPDGVTSDGLYQLTDIDLAAPFGPVTGMSTELRFTDLLGMNTEPGQVATVREINPGVIATEGVITYQFLDSNRVLVEGARWPFAGGHLTLEPTILDFRVDQARRLVFQVEGVDAFQFLEARDFENIVATGMFDGKLPMIFDSTGGRIERGHLVSRRGGGTFSYVGEISDVNLGVFGSLAFNALELIRYSELEIEFDGAIDGEMVTLVSFTGVSPNLAREDQSFLVAGFTNELAEIPIRFDITMNAPFNQMLYSFRLLDDPGFLVNQAIRARINRTQAERGVQPPESGIMP